MNEMIIFGVIFTVLFIFVALLAKLALFCRRFAEDTQQMCRKMDRAESYEEYCIRRDELRCHYLTLIPFVTEKNVKRLHDRIFRKADSAESKERKDSLVPLLLPSVLGVCICTLCLCGMTWAWYSTSIETPTQKITAACFDVTVVSVMDGDTEAVKLTSGKYALEKDKSYAVTLKAIGSAKECGGYCLIECGDTKYYTQTFKPDDVITITLSPGADGEYTFTGVWGSIPSAVAKDEIIKAGAENAGGNATNETTAVPVDSSEPPTGETTAGDPVTPKPESTASYETTPDESDSTPVEPSDSVPSDTPVTDPAPDPVPDSSAVTEEPTDFDTDSSASDEYAAEEEKPMD